MKRLFLAGLTFGALAVPAAAADLSIRPAYDMPARAVHSWTGCYGGVNIGGGASPKTIRDTNGTFSTFVPVGGNLGSHTARGVVGGGQLGCDYELGPLVVGLQGIFDASGMKGNNFLPFGTLQHSTFIQWIATATARVGLAVLPTTLLYVKGGGAWAHDVFEVAPPLGVAPSNASNTARGWTAGLGIERIFYGTNISIFAEYDYLDFGTPRVTFSPSVFAPTVYQLDIRQKVNLFLFGLNYRFGASNY